MQQILELASNLPGLGHLAGTGASKIEEMRRNLNLVTTEEVEAKKKKEPQKDNPPVTNNSPKVGAVSVDSFLGTNGGGNNAKSKGVKGSGSGSQSDGLNMSGSKGNRTMNVTLTIHNHFSGNSRNSAADKIVGQITDRLRDGLAALE